MVFIAGMKTMSRFMDYPPARWHAASIQGAVD
jgi:hypothetical protein